VLTYVLSSGPFIKVGRACDVRVRVAALQIGNPIAIEIVSVIAGDLERVAHELLAANGIRRVRGEWFEDGTRARELLWTLGFEGDGFAFQEAAH
jgi:hypothetical protein